MIYLDNSATSFPKPAGMAAEMGDCMERYCGNPGRSGHDMSMMTGERVYQARKETARLFHIRDASRLVFTKNTTESLNLALLGMLKEGDHVVTTSMEHNSVLRPLEHLRSKGVSHTIVSGSEEGFVSAEDIEAAVTEDTRLVAVTGGVQCHRNHSAAGRYRKDLRGEADSPAGRRRPAGGLRRYRC